MVLGGALYTAPLKEPLYVLDLGTGTGIWAIEMAEEFPAAVVHGTDISPIQPEWVPANCHFYIDDVESPWVFKQPFDYIHGRSIGNVIGDWKKFHAEAYDNLKPGGWLEIQDFEGYFGCDDDTVPADAWIERWTRDIDKGGTKFGKNMNIILNQRQLMTDAGLVNIQSQFFKVSLGLAWLDCANLG